MVQKIVQKTSFHSKEHETNRNEWKSSSPFKGLTFSFLHSYERYIGISWDQTSFSLKQY